MKDTKLASLMPMPPREGPPLPKKLNVSWSLLWVIATLPYQVVKTSGDVQSVIRSAGSAWHPGEML